MHAELPARSRSRCPIPTRCRRRFSARSRPSRHRPRRGVLDCRARIAAEIADRSCRSPCAALSPFPTRRRDPRAPPPRPAAGAGLSPPDGRRARRPHHVLVFAAGEIDATRITLDAWAQILLGLALLSAPSGSGARVRATALPVSRPGGCPRSATALPAPLASVRPLARSIPSTSRSPSPPPPSSITTASPAPAPPSPPSPSWRSAPPVLAIVLAAALGGPTRRPDALDRLQALHAAPQQHHHGGHPRRPSA